MSSLCVENTASWVTILPETIEMVKETVFGAVTRLLRLT